MKRMMVSIGLCFSSSLALASNGCNFLTVSIQNFTGYTCALQAVNVNHGTLAQGQFPQFIFNGEASPTFQIEQGYFSGPEVQIEFVCGNRGISLKSSQTHSYLSAGEISGEVFTNHNVHAKYVAAQGSCWASQPGMLMWTIF